MRQHTDLFPTDSLPRPPPPFLQIEPVMSVEMQTMQTPDCRLQTVQTVQTVQTECYFFTCTLIF